MEVLALQKKKKDDIVLKMQPEARGWPSANE
jgi:hypothetical protein